MKKKTIGISVAIAVAAIIFYFGYDNIPALASYAKSLATQQMDSCLNLYGIIKEYTEGGKKDLQSMTKEDADYYAKIFDDFQSLDCTNKLNVVLP